jgi:hypothetical protein
VVQFRGKNLRYTAGSRARIVTLEHLCRKRLPRYFNSLRRSMRSVTNLERNLIGTPRGPLGLQIQDAFKAAALLLNLLLKQSNGIDQLLWTGWASRNIYINGNDLIHALDERVVVENSP